MTDSADDRAGEPAATGADPSEAQDEARAAASLAKDVAKWSVDRHTRERIAEEELAELKPSTPAPVAPKPRAKPKAVVAAPAPAVSAVKKPFSMSFGGISNEDYIASLRAKGRR